MSGYGAYIGAGALALSACASAGANPQSGAESAQRAEPVFAPVYEGIETRLLDDTLVNFRVAMRGARDADDVTNYADCAAAQYTLIRGYGFARHLRTNVSERSGLWEADAVYTVSADLPKGTLTIDADVAAANCAANGIPTV
ncbi:hypothetical protein [Pseudooceanicola spongiae]|uniref:hypothetical protein n=1 Tax=Pseudooceanicola spongiae TaxID=2613965 RepID=UPI0018683241|nr:hypothetical protein [Pseudooceanicola spongiae]|tara:strand:- start:149 stop:574 length:426 start_codon:yes stop_codon:yes gene_type:complete